MNDCTAVLWKLSGIMIQNIAAVTLLIDNISGVNWIRQSGLHKFNGTVAGKKFKILIS